MLQSLNLMNTQVSDVAPLAALNMLQRLYLADTQVSDVAPLAALNMLQSLNLAGTKVSDFAPLAALSMLQSLSLMNTQVSDVAPLAALNMLQSLDLEGTQVSDVAPLAGLPALQSLDASQCRLDTLPDALLDRLSNLVLTGAQVPGIPQELFSTDIFDSCLERLRAHRAALAASADASADARLLLLGNGLVGKTQIARWLACQPFDPEIPSTHGIQLGSFTTPRGQRFRIWDFGGQEIYHGTHALFLSQPAVTLAVWTPGREPDRMPHHELAGLRFRNHPLAWWGHLINHSRHGDSPVIFVQSQCDTAKDEIDQFPVAPEVRAALSFKREARVSALRDRGKDALVAAIGEAVDWMQAPEQLGRMRIPAGWIGLQRRIEELQDADQSLPPEQRRNRWMERGDFDALCTELGNVPDSDTALYWLNATGCVLHRPPHFQHRVILDQGWALDAIYALFDRDNCYRQILSARGRFTPWLLGETKWRHHAEKERWLLLGMMRSAGICFVHRRQGAPWETDPHDEYIAPDLLPEQNGAEVAAGRGWNAEPEHISRLTYPLLPPGLLRGVMAAIGEIAGPDGDYWRDGLFAYEKTCGSRLWIEQQRNADAIGGALLLRTQSGDARGLLERLQGLVVRVEGQFGIRHTVEQRQPKSVSLAIPTDEALSFAQPIRSQPQWYVSYAWKDDKSDAGRDRETKVDAVCEAARLKGKTILRDKDSMQQGDSIRRFMSALGEAPRVFVFLSDKYLRSAFCMFELSEIWRHSKQDGESFKSHARFWILDDADIWTPEGRVAYARFWRERHEKLSPDVRDLGGQDLIGWNLMRQFHANVGNILYDIADHVQPRNFQDFLDNGFAE